MFPHAIGWFPMVAAWVIIVVHLENAKRDLALITDRKMPDWVDAVIYGTVLVRRRLNSNTHAPSNTTLTCADLLELHRSPGEKAAQARPLACY